MPHDLRELKIYRHTRVVRALWLGERWVVWESNRAGEPLGERTYYSAEEFSEEFELAAQSMKTVTRSDRTQVVHYV